jgi:hypothetical protein
MRATNDLTLPAFKLEFAARMSVAAEAMCRFNGLDPNSPRAGVEFSGQTNLQWARTQCERTFGLAESLRIAGLGGSNAS